MKVLLFCFLAFYGALAQEDAAASTDVEGNAENGASADANADASSDSSSFTDSVLNVASKFTPGNVMDKTVSALEAGIDIKGQVVNGSLEIFKDGISLGTTAAAQGLAGAKELVQSGFSTAENVKTTATSHIGSMVGKGFGLANTITGNRVSGIVGALNSTAQGGINAGDKVASMGMSLATNVGSVGLDSAASVVGKVGSGLHSGLNFAGKVDKAINSKIVGGANSFVNAASSFGQKAGNLFANAWKLPTRSNQ